MSDVALRIEDVWKRYAVGGAQPHSTFYDLLTSSMRAPFSRRAPRAEDEGPGEFWALRGIDATIRQGEVVGIVGRNGAGKSTMLKVLSRITPPTKGRIEIHGRMASLLEVGTGFHPELSGRENVFLNGAILGMTRKEVTSKFDEIVEFSEVGKFIDTPVKHYSSGMYVRLAFAVAAHLETDVLLVDEVLAVGDAAFQRKSLGKMGNVAKRGKTVLFVSHNLAAVRNLCTRALVFEKGKLAFDGDVGEGIAAYERSFGSEIGIVSDAQFNGALAGIVGFQRLVCLQAGKVVDVVDPAQPFTIELSGNSATSFPMLEVNIKIFRDGFHVFTCHDTERESAMQAGPFRSRFEFPAGVFRAGRYSVGLGAYVSTAEWVWGGDAAILEFGEHWFGGSAERSSGAVSVPFQGERRQEDSGAASR